MPYTSNLPAVRARFVRAQDAGLVLGATLYRNRMKVRLLKGFKGGRFVTGRSANAATFTMPTDAPGGGRQLYAGTNVFHDLMWEIGHMNLFTRQFEREETWRPILVDSRLDIQAEFQRGFNLVMRGGGA